jgi:peptidoglycan-N-acetylglucosamine deacetylase
MVLKRLPGGRIPVTALVLTFLLMGSAVAPRPFLPAALPVTAGAALVRTDRPGPAYLSAALPRALPNPPVLRPISVAARLPVVFSVLTSERVVALSFDLDMTSGMLADLRAGVIRSWIDQPALAQLRAKGIRATLFMTGIWTETYPALARELAQSGQFEIGNHSYSHPAFHTPCYGLPGRNDAGLAWELDHAQQVIQRITGVTPEYFRFPGGCLNPRVVAMARARALTPIQFSLNSADAFNPSSIQVAATVITNARPGDIILMHLMGGPNAPSTGAALRNVIPALQAKGYRFVTISELLALGPAVQPADFRGFVSAPAPRPSGPRVGTQPAGGPPYWVWTPWGWQKLSHPPSCRWLLDRYKQWVCR